MQSNGAAARIPSLKPLDDKAIRGQIEQFEATGSPVITDGKQRKYQNFATYAPIRSLVTATGKPASAALQRLVSRR